MYKLKRLFVWVRRMRYSRGFGVQSPYDYRFIRYVVNEHWPYYAYDELKGQFPEVDRKTLRLCRLFLRMSNWRQAGVIIDYCPPTSAYATYMQAGCRRSRIISVEDSCFSFQRNHIDVVELCRMSLTGDYRIFYEQLIGHVDNHSVLVVEEINRDKVSKAFWQEVCADSRTGVTFDLYYCGIVFFNKQRYKQHYVVNF